MFSHQNNNKEIKQIDNTDGEKKAIREVMAALRPLLSQKEQDKLEHNLTTNANDEVTNRLRPRLSAILEKEHLHEEKSYSTATYDHIYNALLLLAHYWPLNKIESNQPIDVITQEPIEQNKKVCISTGHQRDVRSLAQTLRREQNKNHDTHTDFRARDLSRIRAFITHLNPQSGTRPLTESEKKSRYNWMMKALLLVSALCFLLLFVVTILGLSHIPLPRTAGLILMGSVATSLCCVNPLAYCIWTVCHRLQLRKEATSLVSLEDLNNQQERALKQEHGIELGTITLENDTQAEFQHIRIDPVSVPLLAVELPVMEELVSSPSFQASQGFFSQILQQAEEEDAAVIMKNTVSAPHAT